MRASVRMMDEVAPVNESGVRPRWRKKRYFVPGLSLLTLLAVFLVAWANRETIANDFIRDQLDAYGIEGTYDVERIGGQTQILSNLVIGDPARPDLTAERVIVKLEYRLGLPEIGSVSLVRPRLYGTYLDKADYQKHTAHGTLTSQFGIPSEEVISLLESTKLSISGLHSHVGTQMDNVEIFQENLSALHELCEVIHAITDHKIDTLNLGGGLGIASHREDSFPSIAQLEEALKRQFKPEYTYKMEPGSALLGEATALLTQVITRKTARGKGWAIVDVGSDQLFKVTLAGFSQEVLSAEGALLPREGPDSIAGPLCFAGDVILPATDLTGVEEGDLLILPNAGSYCKAISNRFNGQSEPGTLIVQEDLAQKDLIQENQTKDKYKKTLAYIHEDSYWEPIIQGYLPQSFQSPSDSPKIFADQQVDKLRSVYLHKQCGADTYAFHEFTKLSDRNYTMAVSVNSQVSFLSAPLVMRIISDATIAVVIDSLGSEEKEISVWGSRFNVSLDSILRSDRRHPLNIQLTPKMTSKHSKKREFIAHWQLGKGASHGNILVVV